MSTLAVQVANKEETALFGVWMPSSGKTIAKDIPSLSKRYHIALSPPEKTVFPFCVLTRNYDEANNTFELFIGSTLAAPGLQAFTLPAGEYASIAVRPKLAFLWGPAIGQAKRFFYTEWLPASPYRGLNMEFEWHTEKSVGRAPEIDLLFAVEKNGAEAGTGDIR